MFDPSLPADHSPNSAAQMRGQLISLKNLIDAVPAGPPGAPGVQGPPFANAVVEAVTTVPAGGAATVSVFFDGTDVRFTFGIPQGEGGVQGQPGPQGPAFANAVIDSVGTLNPGDNATVSVFFDGSAVHFSFGIPRGAQGEQGLPGPQGEVTNAALAGAIDGVMAQSSNASNGVAALGMTVSDPPTQSEMQAIANKLDELIAALRR